MWTNVASYALNRVLLADLKLSLTWAAVAYTSAEQHACRWRPELMDCMRSTERGCEISLDLSWYCYTIWNETLSQGESNYLSSFGPWICNIFFPLQSLFAVCLITSSTFLTNLTYDLAKCIYSAKSFCFFEWRKSCSYLQSHQLNQRKPFEIPDEISLQNKDAQEGRLTLSR